MRAEKLMLNATVGTTLGSVVVAGEGAGGAWSRDVGGWHSWGRHDGCGGWWGADDGEADGGGATVAKLGPGERGRAGHRRAAQRRRHDGCSGWWGADGGEAGGWVRRLRRSTLGSVAGGGAGAGDMICSLAGDVVLR
jgi:hypothetical protein